MISLILGFGPDFQCQLWVSSGKAVLKSNHRVTGYLHTHLAAIAEELMLSGKPGSPPSSIILTNQLLCIARANDCSPFLFLIAMGASSIEHVTLYCFPIFSGSCLLFLHIIYSSHEQGFLSGWYCCLLFLTAD